MKGGEIFKVSSQNILIIHWDSVLVSVIQSWNLINYLFHCLTNKFLFLGTAIHDSAFFLKSIEKRYVGIHYNPNPTGSMKVISQMHCILGLQSRLFGYHDPKGNPNGMCSLLSWKENLCMFLDLKDPFNHSCLYPYNAILKYCPRHDDPLLLLQKMKKSKTKCKMNVRKKSVKFVGRFEGSNTQ